MHVEPDLVVDVGMHRGDDTAFYLAKGFRVLAIEADPDLVASAQERFGEEIAARRLTIVHCAIADRAGSVQFYSSDREGWGSLDPVRAGTSTGAMTRQVEVPAATFAEVMGAHASGRVRYVKIDIEGADSVCVDSLCAMHDLPRFVSFEADLGRPGENERLIDALASVGYERFALVNQALNPGRTCPDPPREGDYVDARFTHEMSGLFGREVGEPWCAPEDLKQRVTDVVAQQRLRTAVGMGSVAGLPVGRLRSPLKAVYNVAPVTRLRVAYAKARGREVGGWFDVHARLRGT